MTSLTAKLTEYIQSKPISDEDISAAELFALDAIANTIAGRNSVPGRKILAWQQAPVRKQIGSNVWSKLLVPRQLKLNKSEN